MPRSARNVIAGRSDEGPTLDLAPFATNATAGTPATAQSRPAEAVSTQNRSADRARRYIQECVKAGIPRHALLLRLANLPRGMARPHHLRLARAAVDQLACCDRVTFFTFGNGDLLAIWRGDLSDVQAQVIKELRLLFDPALCDECGLIAAMLLPDQSAELLDLIGTTSVANDVIEPSTALPLDTAALGELENGLARADIARFARRKVICQQQRSGNFTVLWEKRFLSVVEIMNTLVPGHDAKADPWLFRRLTRSFDRRMLATLGGVDELQGATPFSVNLNVSSLLSPDFLHLDLMLPPRLRGHVVLDLEPADIMADLSAFSFAREFAHARGYRLLLRGITPDLLDVFPPARIGVDFLQLRWEPDFARIDLQAHGVDPDQIVLAAAHGPEAGGWAQDQGIRLFRYARLADAAKSQVTKAPVTKSSGTRVHSNKVPALKSPPSPTPASQKPSASTFRDPAVRNPAVRDPAVRDPAVRDGDNTRLSRKVAGQLAPSG